MLFLIHIFSLHIVGRILLLEEAFGSFLRDTFVTCLRTHFAPDGSLRLLFEIQFFKYLRTHIAPERSVRLVLKACFLSSFGRTAILTGASGSDKINCFFLFIYFFLDILVPKSTILAYFERKNSGVAEFNCERKSCHNYGNRDTNQK